MLICTVGYRQGLTECGRGHPKSERERDIVVRVSVSLLLEVLYKGEDFPDIFVFLPFFCCSPPRENRGPGEALNCQQVS